MLREEFNMKQCKTNGITISYEEFGQGEPLLLIMGLGAPWRKWLPHIEAYKEHFRVIAPDNRGAGQSEKPVRYAYTIEEMAKDMIGLLDELGIEKTHINGISMGGAIGLYMAVYYPERVKSLIVTNSFPYCCNSFRRSIEVLREVTGQLDPVTATRLGQWMIFSQPFQETDEDYMLKCEYEDLNDPYPMPAYAYKAQCNAILGFDIRDRLKDIKAPTIIIGGDRDLFVPVKVSKMMADEIPGAELYIAPDGGHVQHWEQLEKYNEISLQFLLSHN